MKLVTRTKANLNDDRFNLGSLLIDRTNGFHAIGNENRVLPYKNRIHNSITYEMSLTREEYERTVYSSLNLLGDIGGLFGALVPIGRLLILAFQYRGDSMFVMSMMLSEEDGGQKKPEGKNDRGKYFGHWSCCRMFYLGL